jgi:hypothetical protein
MQTFYSQEAFDEYQRELEGDGYTNEFARASAESLLLSGGIRNDTDKAHRLTLEGKFVVLAHWPHHCRITDAVLGEGIGIEEVFDTEAAAEAYRAQFFGAEYGEYYWSLYRLPVPAAAPAERDLDDIPF